MRYLSSDDQCSFRGKEQGRKVPGRGKQTGCRRKETGRRNRQTEESGCVATRRLSARLQSRSRRIERGAERGRESKENGKGGGNSSVRELFGRFLVWQLSSSASYRDLQISDRCSHTHVSVAGERRFSGKGMGMGTGTRIAGIGRYLAECSS